MAAAAGSTYISLFLPFPICILLLLGLSCWGVCVWLCSARQGEREREESGGGDGGEGVERDGGVLPAAGRLEEAPDGGEPAAPRHAGARHRHRRLRDLPRRRGRLQPPLPPLRRPPPPLDRVGGHARRPAPPPRGERPPGVKAPLVLFLRLKWVRFVRFGIDLEALGLFGSAHLDLSIGDYVELFHVKQISNLHIETVARGWTG